MGSRRLALLALALLAGCVKLDSFLFDSQGAKLSDYDFTSDALDGIDPSRITSELVPVGGSGDLMHVIWVERDVKELDPRLDPADGITVVFSHGNTGNMLRYWYRVGYFEDMGFNVLMYDYRGYGASTGTTTEAHVYEDAETAYDYARKRRGAGAVISVGYSLGGAPAIHLCSPSSGREAAACFTESAFASVDELVKSGTDYDLPGSWLADSGFDNASHIATVTVPFMIMHGTADATVDYRQSRILWRAVAGNNPLNRFYRVEGATHHNVPVPSYDGDEEPREFSHPDEMPPALHREFEVYKKRIVDFVVDAMGQ
jgi:uncharacterized protein